MSGRTAVAVAGALLWILVTIVQTGSSGWWAVWTNALFVLELFVLASVSRTVSARTVVTMFLAGGAMLTVAIIGSRILVTFHSDPGDTSRDILVPLMEECLKILPVLFLLWRWRRGRAWTLGAMDVLLMAAASGAGFAVVESAFIRHRFGWPSSLVGLPGTEVFANRLNLGHGIWAALAGATIGLALFIRWRRPLALALGASGLVIAALDHMANNLTAGGKAFGKALDAVMAHGHGVLLLFFALALASLAIDGYIAYVKRPRLAELEPPTLGTAPASLVQTWRFHLDRRELLYAGFRRRLSPVPDQAPPEAVIWSLITSLVDRHISSPQAIVGSSPAGAAQSPERT